MSFPQLILAIALEVSVDITNQGAIAAYGEFVQSLNDTLQQTRHGTSLLFNHSSPKSIAHPVTNAT